MKIVLLLLFCVITGILSLWIYGFTQANDFSVRSIHISKLQKIEKVLVLFPHPDDEALSMGGTLFGFAQHNIGVDWVVFTKGEEGTEDAHYENTLKQVRSIEAKRVAKILRVKSLQLKDYPDNGIDTYIDKLRTDIEAIIIDKKPDLIVTYDKSGGYGHPDHIAISQVVSQLVDKRFPHINLWYISTPQMVVKKLSLPIQMAKDDSFIANRTSPTIKIWIGLSGLIQKIKAVYSYQSQRNAYVKSVPFKQIPLWFYISLTPFEYYHVVE